MKIPCDKWAHFFGGSAAAFAGAAVYGPAAGFIISCAVWLLKETVDALGFGTPDRYDFIASVVGAAGALAFLVYIK